MVMKMKSNIDNEEAYGMQDAIVYDVEVLETERGLAPRPQKRGMNRLIRNLPALPRFEDKAQRRAGGNIVKFLALLLVLTLIARGTSGATLARVELSAPSRNEIVEAVTGNATVSVRDSLDITAPEGLTIVEMLVGAGQTVNNGDALALFDLDEINAKLTRETAALDKLLLDLEKLDRTENTDSTSLDNATRNLKRAQDDYDAVEAQGESDISAANDVLDEAWNKLLEDPEAGALENALRSLTRAQEDYNKTLAQGIADVATAQTALNDALKTGVTTTADPTSIDNALRSRNRAREDYNTVKAQGEADVAAVQTTYDNAVENENNKKEEWEADETNAEAEQAYLAAQAETKKAQDTLNAAKKKASDDLLSAARRVEDAESSYTQAQNNYANSYDSASTTRQTTIDRARDTLATEQKRAEENLQSAARRVEDAEISFANAEKDYKKNAENASTAKETAIENAQKALDAAKKKADDNLQSAARRVEDSEISLATAERDYNRNTQQTADTRVQNRVSAVTARLDIEDKKSVVDALDMLVLCDGVLYADIEGVVLTAKAEGSVTGKDALVAFMDGARGFEATVQLAKTDADKLAVGDECQVTTGGGSMYYTPTATAMVSTIFPPDDQDRVRVTIRLPEGDWSEGQRIEVRAVQSRSTYDQCVPLSAVRSDNSGYYLLTVQQESTVLGVSNIVIRVPVTITAADDDNAAVQGPLGRGSQVITGSNKSVSAGDRVRVDS